MDLIVLGWTLDSDLNWLAVDDWWDG